MLRRGEGLADMQVNNLIVVVTFLALLVYFWTTIRVGGARGRTGVAAPSVTGHPDFERAYRVQLNTLEWLPLFLPSLWLFAYYWDPRIGAGIGLVWVAARIYYAVSYSKDPAKRGPGFGVQALCTGILLVGALGKAAYLLATGG